MFPGISSYTFPWAVGMPGNNFTAFQLLEYAADQHIKFVQFGDNLPLAGLPVSELAALKYYAGQHDINIQVGTRKLCRENIERHIELAVFFNTPFIRMVIDDKKYEPSPGESISMIREILHLLEENKKVLAIENHDRFTAATLKTIIEATDTQLVGICLDTANSLGAGEGINEVLRLLAPYTVNLHVKDICIKRLEHKMGFTAEGVAAGDGIIDIANIIAVLRATDRCQVATLEVWSSPQDSSPQTLAKERKLVQKSIQYLKQLLA